MKIRIEGNQFEKEICANAVECPLTEDFNEIIKGKFGFIEYFPGDLETGRDWYVEIDLNSAFIAEIVFTIKTLVKVFTVVLKSLFEGISETITKSQWTKDITNEQFDKDGYKLVKLFSKKDGSIKFKREHLIEIAPEDRPVDLEVFEVIGGDNNGKLVYIKEEESKIDN